MTLIHVLLCWSAVLEAAATPAGLVADKRSSGDQASIGSRGDIAVPKQGVAKKAVEIQGKVAAFEVDGSVQLVALAAAALLGDARRGAAAGPPPKTAVTPNPFAAPKWHASPPGSPGLPVPAAVLTPEVNSRTQTAPLTPQRQRSTPSDPSVAGAYRHL